MAGDRARDDEREQQGGATPDTSSARTQGPSEARRDAELDGGGAASAAAPATASAGPAQAVDTSSIRAEILVSVTGAPPAAHLVGPRLARARREERAAVLADTALMERMHTALTPAQYLECLDLLRAPLRQRLETALAALSGEPRFRYTIDKAFEAPTAEQQALLADAAFLQALRRPFDRTQWARVLESLGASLETKVRFALERANADNSYLRRLLARATPEERTALMAQQDLRERIDRELGANAADQSQNTDPVAVARSVRWGNPAGALDLITVVGEAQARMDRFDGGRAETVSLLGQLPRGAAMPADVRDDVDTIIQVDSNTDRVKKAFEVRWDAGTRRERGPRSRSDQTEVDAPAWSAPILRSMHNFLLQCPDLQGTGQVPAYVLRGTYQGGAFSPRTREIIIGGGVSVSDTVSGELMNYGDADLSGPQGVREVNLMGAVIRHEIGHAVDDRLGAQSDGLKVGLGGFWSGTDFSQWFQGGNAFEVRRPGPTVPAVMSEADQATLRTALTAYMNGAGTAPLRDGLAATHPMVVYWDAGVPALEAFKGIEGQGKRFWTRPNALYADGGFVYSVNPYYHFLQRCNASVRDNIMRPYQLFSHMEFFAEMYSVYYEDGHDADAQPGQRVPVSSWRAWFDQNVHGPGMAPQSMRGVRPRSGARGGAH